MTNAKIYFGSIRANQVDLNIAVIRMSDIQFHIQVFNTTQ